MKMSCFKPEAGYGLALLMLFMMSTVLLGSSLQIMSYQGSRVPMTASIDNLMARETAASAFEVVRSDILSKLNAKTTVDTSYRYPVAGSNTISMPADAANLGGATSAVGSYYATITQARGNSYLVTVTATAGASTVSLSQRIQVQSTCSPDTMFTGRAASDNAGGSAAFAGDVNGDGYGDLLIGARNADGGGASSGEAYLILGRNTIQWQAQTNASGQFSLNTMSDAIYTVRFIGRNAGDNTGHSVSPAGDVNNDGYDDLLIGARNADGGGADSGEAYLILGRSTANWQALTDVNGDFNLDNTSDANLVFRFLGRNETSTGDQLGYSLNSAGDVNNDGYEDILLSAWEADGGGVDSGEAYLILGRSTANWQALTDASGNFNLDNTSDANLAFRLVGRVAGDRLGSSASSAGDVNNDGYKDILMGARSADGGGGGSGEAYLILGRSTANWQALTDASGNFNLDNTSDANLAFRFIGRNAGENLGSGVSGGDVNGDGYADVVIGAFGGTGGGTDSGEAYLLLGRSTANWQALTDASGNFDLDNTSDANLAFRFIGRASGNRVGYAVSADGDVNGDGYTDVLMGSDVSVGLTDREVYLILGRSTANWQALTDASGNFDLNNTSDANNTVRLWGRTSGGGQVGASISSSGDANGDGYADLLVGADKGSASASQAGEVYLILGRKTSGWQAFTDASGNFDWDDIYVTCNQG